MLFASDELGALQASCLRGGTSLQHRWLRWTGGGALLLCVASGGRSSSAPSIVADDPARSVGR